MSWLTTKPSTSRYYVVYLVISIQRFSQRREEPRKTLKVRNRDFSRLHLLSSRLSASGEYCSELKERLQERERELGESRATLLLLQQELSHTKAELTEARSKLDHYEKLPGAGKEMEQVATLHMYMSTYPTDDCIHLFYSQ